MISESLPYSYTVSRTTKNLKQEDRFYIFLCDALYEDGEPVTHLYIFDELGGCFEARYFFHAAYRERLLNSLVTDKDGICVWELVPHGNPPLPPAHRFPRNWQADNTGPVAFDNLYAQEEEERP